MIIWTTTNYLHWGVSSSWLMVIMLSRVNLSWVGQGYTLSSIIRFELDISTARWSASLEQLVMWCVVMVYLTVRHIPWFYCVLKYHVKCPSDHCWCPKLKFHICGAELWSFLADGVKLPQKSWNMASKWLSLAPTLNLIRFLRQYLTCTYSHHNCDVRGCVEAPVGCCTAAEKGPLSSAMQQAAPVKGPVTVQQGEHRFPGWKGSLSLERKAIWRFWLLSCSCRHKITQN